MNFVMIFANSTNLTEIENFDSEFNESHNDTLTLIDVLKDKFFTSSHSTWNNNLIGFILIALAVLVLLVWKRYEVRKHNYNRAPL